MTMQRWIVAALATAFLLMGAQQHNLLRGIPNVRELRSQVDVLLMEKEELQWKLHSEQARLQEAAKNECTKERDELKEQIMLLAEEKEKGNNDLEVSNSRDLEVSKELEKTKTQLEETQTQLSSAESQIVDLMKSLQEQATQLDNALLEREKQKAQEIVDEERLSSRRALEKEEEKKDEKSSQAQTSIELTASRHGEEDAVDKSSSIAVLISGQCSRFIYKDQQVPLFTDASPPDNNKVVDVYIALQCGKQVKAGIGNTDSPPYMQKVNVTDIEHWYLSKGANKVQVKLLDDNAMDPKVAEITKHAVTIKGDGDDKARKGRRPQLLTSIQRGYFQAGKRKWKHRWEIEAHKLYLRHVVYSLSRSHQRRSYGAYVYMREDNYFLAPMDMDRIFFNNTNATNNNRPFVVVDANCMFFGAYSDKMYVANEPGADLLFGRTFDDFLQQMKFYALFGWYRKDFNANPMQPEAFMHSRLSAVNVEMFDLQRTDVRYLKDQRCVPHQYFLCMPRRAKSMIKQNGLTMCNKMKHWTQEQFESSIE
jgi:hypothetical protein